MENSITRSESKSRKELRRRTLNNQAADFQEACWNHPSWVSKTKDIPCRCIRTLLITKPWILLHQCSIYPRYLLKLLGLKRFEKCLVVKIIGKSDFKKNQVQTPLKCCLRKLRRLTKGSRFVMKNWHLSICQVFQDNCPQLNLCWLNELNHWQNSLISD